MMAALPLGVYYGGVVRMYALAPSFLLLAMYGAGRMLTTRGMAQPAFVIGAAGAMYTLYHAAWALFALGLWLLLRVVMTRDKQLLARLISNVTAAVLLYAPWAIYGIPHLLGRAAAETGSNTNQRLQPLQLMGLALRDVALSETALIIIALLLCGGMLAAAIHRRLHTAANGLLLPLLLIALTLTGVSIAARQWAFNARMLICAIPPLALALGWAVTQIGDGVGAARRPFVLAAQALVLIAAHWPVSTQLVYAKSLEVFGEYSSTTYRDGIRPFARAGDRVFFNVLSPAGFFASQRSADDPSWSYALTWDPVKEPRADWEIRITDAAKQHDRLWIVLYRGLAENSNNGALRGWMDSHYFPATSFWDKEETYFGLYGVADPHSLQPGASARWETAAISLDNSAIQPAATPGGIVAVRLHWRLTAPVTRPYKVFVHLTKADGFVISQHDAAPLNDLRPFTALPIGATITDHHGLAVPLDANGELSIRLGVYDPDTQTRLKLADGSDSILIGTTRVNQP
jgi:hypothetical protein